MPSHTKTARLKQLLSILIFVVIVAHIIGTVLILAEFPLKAPFNLAVHQLLEVFSAYISLLLTLFCFRVFHVNGFREFHLWGLGFLSFFVLQIFQVFTYPGFSNFNVLPASINISAGFEVAARLLLSVYLLGGFIKLKTAVVNKIAIWSLAMSVLILIVSIIVNIRQPLFYLGSPQIFKKALDVAAAALLFIAASFVFIKKNNGALKGFWILITSMLTGCVTNIYNVLWQTSDDLFFHAAGFAKPVFLSLIFIGLVIYKNRVSQADKNLAESLEQDSERLVFGARAIHELVENIPEGVLITNTAGTVKFVNKTLARLLHYEKNVLLGLHVSIFFDAENYERFAIQSIQSNGRENYIQELDLQTRDNKKIPVSLDVSHIMNEHHKLVGAQYFITDLTERRKVEHEWDIIFKEKTKNLQIFQQCMENSTEGILITDQSGKINYVNRSFERMSGYVKSELIGKETELLVNDQQSKNEHEKIWDLAKEGRGWRGEINTKRKDGSSFISGISVIPLQQKQGSESLCLWIGRDISRHKTLESNLKSYAEKLADKTNELESTRTYYKSLISGMSDILLVVDNECQCTFINAYGVKRLGYSARELTNEKLPVFFNDLKKLESDYGAAIQVEIKDFESVVTPKTGEPILCSWYARPLFDKFNNRVGAMAVGRDITEYKKMQDDLQGYAKNLEKSVEDRTVELQQKVTQLAKLLEIGEEIRLNVDVDVIINKICEAVQLLGWKKVIISLRDLESKTAKPVATAGLEPKEIEKVMRWGDIPFEHTDKYFKERYRISHSYFIPQEEDLVTKDSKYSLYSNFGSRKKGEWHSLDALLVPIRTKDKILGIISVDDPADRKRPDLNRIRDLEIFSDKAALAIENSRLVQAQRENEKQAKFLAEVGKLFHSTLKMTMVLDAVVQKGGTAIGEFCSLLLLDEKSNQLLPEASYHNNPRLVDLFIKGTEQYPCPVGEGIIGSSVKTGKASLHSSPFPEDMQGFTETLFFHLNEYNPISSLMVIPLNVRGKIIGIMLFLLFETRRKYKSEELKLAQELADRAALAVENARLFKQAAEKARELENANKLKSEFLANVSHELRTPLNAIITLSDILVESYSQNGDAEQLKQLQIIQRSGRNLLNLINDILDLSKIESGKIEPVYANIPIKAVVEESIVHIKPLCSEKGLTLDYQFDKNLPETIYTDQDKLTRALNNILSNAVKFTRSGKISVAMSVYEKNKIQINVTDTGIGIPSDRMQEIFKEFHQIDSTDSRAYGGTGLGLAITKKVLDIIGGEVTVESQLGKGSTFTIYIPIRADEDLNQKDQPKLPVAQNFTFDLNVIDDRKQLKPDKKTILIIDDENDSLYIMSHYLHENGYQVLFRGERESVIDLINQYHPFAITLDIIMPNCSGWEILHEIKSNPDTQNIPVIITSILSERGRALEMGADEYFTKPFEPQKLLDFLNTQAGNKKRKKSLLNLRRFLSLGKNRVRRIQKPSAPKLEPANSTNSRILLVDDDKDTQYALSLIFKASGYDIHFANEGREALKKAESIRPDLILMDIMMPGMDGYEATKALKANETFRSIPIIAVTAKAMKGDREKTILSGCDDYVAKPFDKDEMLRVVKKWLS